MNARIFLRWAVIVFVLIATTFGVLALRAEWIPRSMARKDFADAYYHGETVTAEVYRVTPVRDLRSLFAPYPDSSKYYECTISHGSFEITSFSFRFPDRFAPELFTISIPKSERSSTTVVFTFNDGFPLHCVYSPGDSVSWHWVP